MQNFYSHTQITLFQSLFKSIFSVFYIFCIFSTLHFEFILIFVFSLENIAIVEKHPSMPSANLPNHIELTATSTKGELNFGFLQSVTSLTAHDRN